MYAKILNVLKTAGLVVALVGVAVALTRPQIINVTVELVTGVNSSNITSDSPPAERAVGAGRNIVLIGLAALIIISLLVKTEWGRSLVGRARDDANRGKVAVILAVLIILGIIQHLIPGYISPWVQLVIVLGIWVITGLVGTGEGRGKKILAYAVAAALTALLIENVATRAGLRPRLIGSTYAATPAVVTASTSATTSTLKAYKKTYEAELGKWSKWHQEVVPEYFDFTFLSTGPIDIETYEPLLAKSETGREYLMPKVFHDTPEITQPRFIVNTPQRSMWRFRSTSGQDESVTFDLWPLR